MKYLLSQICLALLIIGQFSIAAFSQIEYENHGIMSSTGLAFFQSLTPNQDSGYYATGYFWGTTDFDPGIDTFFLTTPGTSNEIFVQKLNQDLSLDWCVALDGSPFTDEGRGIALSASGSILITGVFSDTVDFDPGPGVENRVSNGNLDIFLLELSPNGEFLSCMTFGDAGIDEALDLAVDHDGRVTITGYFNGVVDFDPGASVFNLSSQGNDDVFVLQLDPQLDFDWAVTVGEPMFKQIAYDVEVDNEGNVFVGGYFSGTVDFDPGPGMISISSNGNRDGFILALDSLGHNKWVINVGGTQQDRITGISVDPKGNPVVTGFFTGNSDMDPGPDSLFLTSTGQFDIFVGKYDQADGSLIWAKGFGGVRADEPREVKVDINGAVYTSGRVRDSVDFDPSIGSFVLPGEHHQRPFISKLDSNGNFEWAGHVAPTQDGIGVAECMLIMDYSVLFGGFISTDLDLDPGPDTLLIQTQGSDGYLLEWEHCIDRIFQRTARSCDSILFDGSYISTPGVYQGSFVSAFGCDSIVNLSFDYSNIKPNVQQVGNTLLTDSISPFYQWIDCDNNFQDIIGETFPLFSPSQNGNYALRVMSGNCSDTSDCIQFTALGLSPLNNSEPGLYPNPVTDNLIINLQDGKYEYVQMLNARGQSISRFEVAQGLNTIDLSGYAPGIYFLKFHSLDEKIITRKLIIGNE